MNKTLEDKARFFAQYWGQEALRGQYNGGRMGLYKVNAKEMCDHYFDQPCYLELTLLSSITDEHAIEIGNHLGWRYLSTKAMITQVKEFLDKGMIRQSNVNGRDWIWLIDFLREGGYALPFNGISVEEQIELGWVKLKD